MRRQRVLRNASSTQSLCIFCASRFLQAGVVPTTSISRRRLNTTRSTYQSAATAAAQSSNGNGENVGQSASNQGESTLTASELREKEYRRQQRLAAENARQQEQAEILERRHAAQRAEQERQRENGARQSDGGSSNVFRRFTVRTEDTNVANNTQRTFSENPARDRAMRFQRSNRDRRSQQHAHATQSTTSRQPAAPRMGMPSFGSDASASPYQSTSSGGWGSGVADTRPLEYAEEDEREAKQAEMPSQAWNTAPDTASDVFSRGNNRERFRDRSPSSSQDPFWSSSSYQGSAYRPLRDSTPPASGGFGGTGYRATPFNPAEEPNQPHWRNDGADQVSWNHLRQKGAFSEPPPTPPPQPQSFQQPQRQQQSQAQIDDAFRAHQAERPQRRPLIRRSDAGEGFVNNAQPSQPYQHPAKCARCLEVGHVARECTAPPAQVKATCKACGQVGHMSWECPRKGKARQAQAKSEPRPPFGEQRIRQIQMKSEAPRSPFSEQGVRRMDSSETPGPFDDSTYAPQSSEWREPVSQDQRPARQQREMEWQSSQSPARQVQAEEKDERSERLARRSRRGFEDEDEASAQPQNELRERRKNRRSMEQQDDEARDEANALREERAARKAARKVAKKRAAENADQEPANLTLPEFISVSQLAQVLNVRYERLLERLEQEGYDDVFPGKILNMETSGMIAMEYNFEPQFEYDSAVAREEQERDLKPRPEPDDKSLLPTRPPVVTIMGHVDHGKTTILDFLRKSSVAAGEAGGITQHIGAFSVPMSSSGRTITFLDTPGHAAFLAMRQRGANVTDIVVLVVAADDSVKPQTLESLRCAREAGVPILVAINKVDKDGADVQRVKQDLASNGVEIEDFGGDVQTVEVSGKTGQGMEGFEEAIVTLSEILDHRAEQDGDVEGRVLEATTKSNGRVATVLVKRGTLRVGQVIVAGKTWARVRSLKNEKGQTLQEVGPGMPVEVDGWREQATAGDQVLQAPSEQKAGSVVEYRTEVADRDKMSEDMEAINQARRQEQEKRAKEKAAEEAAKREASTDEPTPAAQSQPDQPTSTGQQTIPFIIKADVSGSAEAVAAYIPSLTSPLIIPQILSSGVGAVNESDIEYAATAQGHIIAFNLPQNNEAIGMAEARGVKVLENDVIYRTLDQVKEVLEEKLPPIVTQRVLGEAEVAAGFEIGVGGRRKMRIAGCKVRNGVIGMRARVRVMRGGISGEKVYDGAVTSLKNVKKDVQEMRKGTECGMGFDDWEGFEVGDVVQTYEEISEKRRL